MIKKDHNNAPSKRYIHLTRKTTKFIKEREDRKKNKLLNVQ